MNISGTVNVEGFGPFRQIEIRREVEATAERVWQAMTSDAEIHHWWVAGVIEPVAGGRYRLGDEEEFIKYLYAEGDVRPPLDGVIRTFIPPSILAIEWHPDYIDAGLVRFDLLPQSAQSTRITLQQNVPSDDALAASAGWYELLERLDQYVTVGQVTDLAEVNRFEQLQEYFRLNGVA